MYSNVSRGVARTGIVDGMKVVNQRTGPPQKQSERGEQTRARLLEATIQSIAHDGVAGASVERITERAGVSRGLIRHYYGSKSRLLAEAFRRLADDYRGMLGIGLAPASRSAEERLRQAILRSFEEIRDVRERQYAWFGFWALARTDRELHRINSELYEDVVDHLGGLIRDVAVEHGRAVDAEAAGRGLTAMIEGAWVLATVGVEGMTLPAAERVCLDYAARLLALESLEPAPKDREPPRVSSPA